MPTKLLDARTTPLSVLNRISLWGKAIRRQREVQRLRAVDLCARTGISETTLRRIEQGDPAVNIGAVLSVLTVLGLVDQAAPPLPEELLLDTGRSRVRLPSTTRRDDDDEYF